jgi:hypothetical protein
MKGCDDLDRREGWKMMDKASGKSIIRSINQKVSDNGKVSGKS